MAAASLVAALGFNSMQVRNGAVSQRQAKSATELGLLTQLQGVMNDSVYSRVPHESEFRALRAGRRANLSPAAYRAVVKEASNMNYFAWLFNNGYIATAQADELWGPRMICEYQQAFVPAITGAARRYPELIEFIQARGPRLLEDGKC